MTTTKREQVLFELYWHLSTKELDRTQKVISHIIELRKEYGVK